tara:strand:- start:309 stop:575 length:267 start_codon:yes stop_codon:yes gene_type:complete
MFDHYIQWDYLGEKMILKRILLLFIMLASSCSSGGGGNDDPGQNNDNALSVGDSFPGFSELNPCSNEDIAYDYSDTSTVILVSFFASW